VLIYNKSELSEKAKELNFNRDTLEKVLRLVDILEFLNTNPLTKNTLALKGGTAINLTVFNLPRLSVDIDLDYAKNVTKEEMLVEREKISSDIKKYMTTQRYSLSEKSRFYHSLDSFVFVYKNLGGVNDNIKIEINYSLRSHIFELQDRSIVTSAVESKFKVLSVAPYELFAGKINALLSRSAVRDLYDIYNLSKYGLFDRSEYDIIRKAVVFYTSISQEIIPESYDFRKIDNINFQKIKTDLLPVIQKGERIELDDMKREVAQFLSDLLILESNEKEFLRVFSQQEYRPDLLFDDKAILARLMNHPMVLWKMQSKL